MSIELWKRIWLATPKRFNLLANQPKCEICGAVRDNHQNQSHTFYFVPP